MSTKAKARKRAASYRHMMVNNGFPQYAICEKKPRYISKRARPSTYYDATINL
jgi:hypothetical protein